MNLTHWLYKHLIFLFQNISYSQCRSSAADSIYNHSEIYSTVENLNNLPDTCKDYWFNYYLALAQFRSNCVKESKITTTYLFETVVNRERRATDYLLKIKIGDLIFLIMEEAHRLKDRTEFLEWKKKLYLLGIMEPHHGQRVLEPAYLTIHIMIERFNFIQDQKWINYYGKIKKRTRKSLFYWRRFRLKNNPRIQ
ncbi:MAG: hypothetical protein MK078_14945 [Crocinitomicaceae bacterium]|nr:hypothetical protein [Crocinitomicaceae bacterium]